MNRNLYLIALTIFCSCGLATAQIRNDYRIHLQSGTFTPQPNLSDVGNRAAGLRTASGKSFVVIQFDEIPSEAYKKELKNEGIELLEYIPNYAYTAVVSDQGSFSKLARKKGRALITLSPEQKMQPGLAAGRIPAYAVSKPGTVDVWINFPRPFSAKEVTESLVNEGFQITSDLFKQYQVLALRVPAKRLVELAALPFIQYVQCAPPADKPLNHKSIINSRANVLSSSTAIGRNLKGEGVVIGIGDDSNPVHSDLAKRIINRSPADAGWHGVHVAGTAVGAGVIDERFTGYAPKANVVYQSFGNIINFTPHYVKDYDMVITNNSYFADINTCDTYGVYDLYSYILDQQAFHFPYLQHVFAAGNNGPVVCGAFPAGFATIQSGYQIAKNIITVGNATDIGNISVNSSKGPVRDGRIKPEIAAQGASVTSTIPTDLYLTSSGTSMAAPAVSGGLALLYQRYRQLHENKNPKNGLMKTLLLNGATDKGNEGPDYRFGFGWLNLLRSVKILESGTYKNDSLGHQETKEYKIQIPANTAAFKIMLYWNDPAAVLLSSKNLVHDLDLKIVTPSHANILPRILDPTPAKVNTVAGTGVDNVNNVEQVVVNNPAQGEYTISVKGSSVGQNPLQEYFVVYDIIPQSLELTYPIGKERLRDGDVFNISWDAYGNATSTFTVQYSLNGGDSWTNISTNVPAANRQFSWTIPAGLQSEKARVRVVQNSNAASSTSEDFTIIGVPTVTLSSLQCEGYISIDWSSVAGATDYEVMMLKGDEMKPVGTTNKQNYVISGLFKDSTYVVSVRARINGFAGRRAVAISRKPDGGSCQGTISDNDLKIESILTPSASGRQNSASQLSNAVFVKIRIKNLDDTDSFGPVDVGYKLNGVAIPVETITPYIEKGKTYDHTFEIGADMSGVGAYTFEIFIHKPNDPVSANDTITGTFRQLSNDPVTLPFKDDMEGLPFNTLVRNEAGVAGDCRYDFSATTDAGRIRTFVNSDFARSGQKALTVDASRYISTGNTNYLIATFNLSNYNVEETDLRLSFAYKNHGQRTNANNKVWIRGTETDSWILAYDLFANQNPAADGYKTVSDIEISKLLSTNSQQFSSTFQIRWGQWGRTIMADYKSGSGYTFDDIELYTVDDDIQMIGLAAPLAASCGLGSQEEIRISVRNGSARLIEQIPVAYQINQGDIVRETISNVDKRTSTEYTFTTKADLSALGAHTIRIWSELETDANTENDEITVDLHNTPVITTFPYLENFEAGPGHWYAKGSNNSWQHGEPVSSGLNTAASGTKIWKTNLAGKYPNKETSYLYSPCFQIGGMSNPALSFSMSVDLETCFPNPCDYAYVEYSGDGGEWTRLGAVGDGTGWYHKTYSDKGAWSVHDDRAWHVATTLLPSGFSSLKIRFAMVSDGSNQREGVGIDDIHVYDKPNGIFDESSMDGPVSANVPGGHEWVHFVRNGKLVASVNPNGQNLGETLVQAHIASGSIRNSNAQYYLNRNITIKPANTSLSDSASVRLYFLDSEADALIAASGCAGCGKPANPFELNISKYMSNSTETEDGSIENSTGGTWTFHQAPGVRIVPFDKGYYAEMRVKTFSEFWFAKGFLGTSNSLPVGLVNFSVRKTNGTENENVIAEWETSSEEHFDRFEVEVAEGDLAYRQNLFTRIAAIAGMGNAGQPARYTFVDRAAGKQGARYYRLKMIDKDSSFEYSRVRQVIFESRSTWAVYPNPSKGVFNVDYQSEAGKDISVKVYDLKGNLYKSYQTISTGGLQKEKVDLSLFSTGLYFMEIVQGQEKRVFELLKE